jgi:hypothetical protein
LWGLVKRLIELNARGLVSFVGEARAAVDNESGAGRNLMQFSRRANVAKPQAVADRRQPCRACLDGSFGLETPTRLGCHPFRVTLTLQLICLNEYRRIRVAANGAISQSATYEDGSVGSASPGTAAALPSRRVTLASKCAIRSNM